MRLERIVILLSIFTVGAILLHSIVPGRVLVIAPTQESSGYRAQALDDSREQGKSTASLERTDSSYIFRYNLSPGAPYPFAILQFNLEKNGRGLDFTKFDHLVLRVRAQGEHTERMRLTLRNFHPDYANFKDPVSLKFNEVHFPANRKLYDPLVIPWGSLSVPGWWIGMKNIPFHQGSVDISNVFWLEFLTPELLREGPGELEIAAIELHGKYIPPILFFQLLLGLWMTVFGIHALLQFWNLRKVLRLKEIRECELLQVNEALSIQTQELEKKASHDNLTGLLNRHGLRDRLFSAMESSRQTGLELSVIFADLDFFKKVNDSHGHETGDHVLIAVAQCLRSHLRETDILARWGGEEFLMVCPGASLAIAEKIAEKLRERVEQLPNRITCSFGVASMELGGSLVNTIAQADKALYQAKSRGRNRVVCA